MKNKKEYIEKAFKNEKKEFLKIKELFFKNKVGYLHVSPITNNLRSFLRLKPLYSGIPQKDLKIINYFCEEQGYNKKQKQQIIDSSGEENYKKAFFYLLKETNNSPEEIEEMLKIRTSE